MNQHQPEVATSCYVARALDGEVAIMTSSDLIAMDGDISVDVSGPGLRLVQNGRRVLETEDLSDWSRTQIHDAPALVVVNVQGNTAGDEELTVIRNVSLSGRENIRNDHHG